MRAASSSQRRFLIFLVNFNSWLYRYIYEIEIAQNPLVKRVIAVFDKNKDGKISFTEFISGLSTLSSAGI